MDIGKILSDSKHITKRQPKKPRQLEDGTGYYWFKGETIELTWTVDGDITNENGEIYIPADEFLVGKTVKVKMFNFLGKKVKEWEMPASMVIRVVIDEELSKEILTGTYTFLVNLYGANMMAYPLFERNESFEVR